VLLLIALALGASPCFCVTPATGTDAESCRRTTNKAEFESHRDGPFVDNIGYSKVLRACIVVRSQGFPLPNRIVHMTTEILDTTNLKSVWEDTRKIPQDAGEPLDYPALNDEIRKLEIELAKKPRP